MSISSRPGCGGLWSGGWGYGDENWLERVGTHDCERCCGCFSDVFVAHNQEYILYICIYIFTEYLGKAHLEEYFEKLVE